MSKNFNTNTDNNQTWITPLNIVKSLGHFDLDPCTPENMPWQTADEMISLPTDGLEVDWTNRRVWCNPPYGKETFKWIEKLSQSRSGIALIFARTETKGFHEHVWDKAHSVFFFKGRIKFCRVDGSQAGSANAPSVLISYSSYDTVIIEEAWESGDISGKLVFL